MKSHCLSPYAAMALLLFANGAAAQVPAVISNQGRLHDGTQLVNGEVRMVLRIYASPTGGDCLYEDTATVTVVDGYYATYLGDDTTLGSLETALAGGEAYVEVEVDGVLFPPRELIPSVAYAVKADRADRVRRGGVTGEMIADGSIGPRHLREGAVDNEHLLTDAVDARAIAAGAITSYELAAGSVTEEKLAQELLDRLEGTDRAGPASSAPEGAATSRIQSSTSPLLRIEPTAASPNLIGGHIANHVAPDVVGSVVGGGGSASQPNVAGGNFATVDGGLGNAARADFSAVGGGLDNEAAGNRSVIGGGRLNRAEGSSSTIMGGYSNAVDGAYAVIAGGYQNQVTGYVATGVGGWNNQAGGAVSMVGGGQDNIAEGSASTVSGGWANQAAGFGSVVAGGQLNIADGSHSTVGGGTNNVASGPWSMIPGGALNTAEGTGSLAAGVGASAAHDGAFVWSDGSVSTFATTGDGQFLIRASGNVGIDTSQPAEKLTIQGNVAPATSGGGTLGTGDLRWRRLFLENGVDVENAFAVVQAGETNLVVGPDQVIAAPGVIRAGRFEGDGSGLTGVTSRSISPGSITDTEISSTAAIDPRKIAGTALSRTTSFGGEVAGTADHLKIQDAAVGESALAPASVSADKIRSGAVTREKLAPDILHALAESDEFWRMGGNALPAEGNLYLGTSTDRTLELRAGGVTAFRIEPSPGTPNILGGHEANQIGANVVGAVISGGGNTGAINRVAGNFATVGGGLSNAAGNEYATVGGGINNNAVGSAATVAGGWRNTAGDLDATIGGGQDNTAGGSASTIAGGFKNSAGGDYSAVPGGTGNSADGAYSLAAGRNAQSGHDGSFVWADSSGDAFASTAPNQFLIRASGNIGLDTDKPMEKLTVRGNVAPADSGAYSLGTRVRRWRSVHVASHIEFEESITLLAGQESRLVVDREGNLTIQGEVSASGFRGDGAGLSNLDGAALAPGSLYDAQINPLAAIDPRKIAGGALTEESRFSGDLDGTYKSLALRKGVVATDHLARGAVTSEKLGSRSVGVNHLQPEVRDALNTATLSWTLQGNRGSRADRDFIGTIDREPLSLRVHGIRALLLEPTAGSPNLIGGDGKNGADQGAVGATISGGGSVSNPNRVRANYGTVAGGVGNEAGNEYATVGGGFGNRAQGFDATVNGGQDNVASGSGSTIGGGYTNLSSGSFSTTAGGARNQADGNVSTIGGGFSNTARGAYATVPGGAQNTAQGDYSLAAGRRAEAAHSGTFVWADSRNAAFTSTGPDQFLIRARGGIGVNLTTPSFPIHVAGGAYCTGSQWVNASDRNAKEDFQSINGSEILEQVAAMPIHTWQYKTEAGARHIGPTAQDFHAAFGVGVDDGGISTVDAAGVALAAIQALRIENRALLQRIEALERGNRP